MVKYLRAANVKDGRLDLDDVKHMNFTPAEQAIFGLRQGDVLVTEGSGSIGAVGASAVWHGEIEETVCFQNTLLRLRPRSTTDPRFLGWWCRHAFADGLFASVATGANIFHVSADRVRSLPMTYLPLAEQRAIADHLDTETTRIDALITKKRRMIEVLDERRRSIVSAAIWGTGRRVRLKHLGIRPTSGNRDHGSFVEDEDGVPCLRGLNIKAAKVSRDALLRISPQSHAAQRTTQLRSGDLVVVRSGAAGAAAVVPEDLDGCNCVDLVVLRRSPKVVPRFLEYVINSREAQEQVTQGSTGAILTHFNAVDAAELWVPALDPQEQVAVVARLDRVDAQVSDASERLACQIDLLVEHRQALITAAVTGELSVPGMAA